MIIFLWLSALIASPITPQNSGDESYSESFTAFADLNDVYVLVQSLFTNAGMGSDKAGCRILHVPKGKKGTTVLHNIPKKEWQASAKRLQVGECYLQKGVKRTVFMERQKQVLSIFVLMLPSKKRLNDGAIKTVGKNHFMNKTFSS